MAVVEVCDNCRREIRKSFIPSKITLIVPKFLGYHEVLNFCSLKCARDLLSRKIGDNDGQDE